MSRQVESVRGAQLAGPETLTGFDPVAVIDIGSNSVRLVAYEGGHRAPAPVFNEKALCGLGGAVASTGELDRKSMDDALAALRRFRLLTRQIGVRKIYAFATAAARDARNGAEFIARAEAACGARIKVFSGLKEARMAGFGVISGIPQARGLVGDMGGGSLELTGVARAKLTEGVTYPLGGLRLMDEAGGSIAKAEKIADRILASEPLLDTFRGQPLYAVGGTWRALARIHMNHHDYPLHVLQQYTIPVRDVLDLTRLIKGLKPSALRRLPGISQSRLQTLPFGAVVLERLLIRLEAEDMVVSALGVREGVLFSKLPKKVRRSDPLLSACAQLAQLRARSPRHAYELCDWTDALFAEGGPAESPEERRLRHAACLLADIGWRAHADYRGEQSLNIIANGAFSGIGHAGRAFLALAIFYRYEGLIGEVLSPRLRLLVDWSSLQRARLVGAALRVAHMISAAMPNVINHTPLHYENDRLVLTLPPALRDLSAPQLEKRLSALAAQLERKAEIRVG